MIALDTNAASECFLALFEEKPFLRNGAWGVNERVEDAAAEVLHGIACKRWHVWHDAGPGVQATARGMLMDLFIKIYTPYGGEFLGREWIVSAASKADQALQVLAHEIEQIHRHRSTMR